MKPIIDEDGQVLVNELGQEVPHGLPIDPPIGYIKQPPLHELIRQMVVSEKLRQEALELGAGSFDDEDDFDVEDPDEMDRSSPWEENFDPHPTNVSRETQGVTGLAPSEAPSETPTAAPPAAQTPAADT